MDHLPGDEFGDGEPDDVHGAVEIGDDASHLGAGQAVRLGTQAEHDLVAVDRVHVEVTATREQPVAASQSSSGPLELRSWLGLNDSIPHPATLVMSSSAQACSPARATRPAGQSPGGLPDQPEGALDDGTGWRRGVCFRIELSWPGLICARKRESKCALISCGDQGRLATARRNQASCLPTWASGRVLEKNTGDGEAAVAARPGPVLPGEPVHPAAAPAITTLSQPHKTRPDAFLLAGRPALSGEKPPAKVP